MRRFTPHVAVGDFYLWRGACRVPSPPMGKAWVVDCYLWRGACREPSSRGMAWWWIATSGVTNIARAFTLEGEGGFSGAGRKKTRMRVCFLRFSSFDRTDAVFVGSFLLRSASAGASFAPLTPLIHRKRSPFPPSGEGLGGGLLALALVWA